MAQSAAWVLLALVTLQVAAAYPARKPELRDGDSGDAIAQALAQANRFKTDAESALKETLKAAAIGDLPVAQAASALAYLSSLAALEQAQRAETLGVQAAAFEVFDVFEDDSTYADFANFDTGESIVSAFKGATDELMDFAQRATQGRRLPREEVDSEIEQFNRLSVSAISEFSSLLDKFILQAKSDMAEAYKQISLWEVEVHQASDAANAASAAAAAAQEAYHQATTPAPTPATTDAPTQSPTNSPTAAPTDAPTQAPTDAPHNIHRKRSSDVDPFEAIKLILTGIDSDYSAYASFAKDYAKNVTKDAFDTAADVIDKNHLYYYQDDYIDALNKMRDGGYDILKASNNKFSEADQAADAADKSLDKYNPRPLIS